jgi:hypothetical protein
MDDLPRTASNDCLDHLAASQDDKDQWRNRFASAHLPEIDVGIVEPGQGTKGQL